MSTATVTSDSFDTAIENTVIKNAVIELFENNDLFEFVAQADKTQAQLPSRYSKSHTPNKPRNRIVGHLSPIHPFLIQIVEHNESEYINDLTFKQLNHLIKKLILNSATHIVFASGVNIPSAFLAQNDINILRVHKNNSPYQYIFNATKHIPKKQTSIHGLIAVIFNQGILITGDSGTGKSSLLLSLLDRGHLWVADDAPHIYLNQNEEIYAAFDEANPITDHETTISAFIHTRNTGVINADHIFGKAKRIPRHKLAAIIHLGNNAQINNTDNPSLSGYKMTSILGQTLPQWTITSNQENLAVIVECIAKQLILNSWGDDASDALITTHESMINSAINSTTTQHEKK